VSVNFDRVPPLQRAAAWSVLQRHGRKSNRWNRCVMMHAALSESTVCEPLTPSNLRPPILPFVCLDHRLAEAAEQEGFPVAGLPAGRSKD
jgi:hypothetical protein